MPGRPSWTPSHPPPASVLPESKGPCLGVASSHSGHLRGTGPPSQQPGRILIPGDGAAGDQGVQNRPTCPAMAVTQRLQPVRLNDSLGPMVSGVHAIL